MMEKVKRVGPHQKVDGVVDEEVDEAEEERGTQKKRVNATIIQSQVYISE